MAHEELLASTEFFADASPEVIATIAAGFGLAMVFGYIAVRLRTNQAGTFTITGRAASAGALAGRHTLRVRQSSLRFWYFPGAVSV